MRQALRGLLLALLCGVVALPLGSLLQADEPGVPLGVPPVVPPGAPPVGGESRHAAEQELATHLANGQFIPAWQVVRRQSDPQVRDQWIAQITAAQNKAGLFAEPTDQPADASEGSPAADGPRGISFREMRGQQGGGVEPDFESLIDLITSTIAPTNWVTVGGSGAIKQFPGGVYVDAQGLLQRNTETAPAVLDQLLAESQPAASAAEPAEAVRRASPLRKVSLPRLERAMQHKLARGEPIDEAMMVLAGLQRVEYLLVYPETGDLVLAGPAGDWHVGREGRMTSVDNGRPTLRLDDLLTLLRHALHVDDSRFGCSITPTQEALARCKAFAEESARAPLRPGERGRWLGELRDQLGAQEIEVYGLAADSRAAQVLVEADYRMKLVGIGLEEGTLGVPSYLDALLQTPGQTAAPMNVLRWWFTLDYDAVAAAPNGRAFQLRGQGVRVLSENELLTATGQRVHTGNSDDPTRQFAHDFTRHFATLAQKYPVYAELQNIFDLALATQLMRSADLLATARWQPTLFSDPVALPLPRGHVPAKVQTVINHRVVQRTQIIAVVSGGVSARPEKYLDPAKWQRETSLLEVHKVASQPAAEQGQSWWWD